MDAAELLVELARAVREALDERFEPDGAVPTEAKLGGVPPQRAASKCSLVGKGVVRK
jgi:hypothetical protein